MLKKIGRDLLIVLGILLLAGSTSRTFMAWIAEQRVEKETWWGVHANKEGDLVAMAYLDKVPKFISPVDYKFTKHPAEAGTVDLYAWGDSYIWKIPDSAYGGIRKYRFSWRTKNDLHYDLDTSQTNILLIEISERYVRSYFSGTDMFEHVKKEQPAMASLPAELSLTYAAIDLPKMEWLFNPLINHNLEFNMFNYNIVNPVRHWKAAMNYYVFGRASGNVVISEDREQLFLKETVKGKKPENSFNPVSEEEIDKIVGNLNVINDHYKQEGFDEVVLTIIPNPATIMQGGNYNGLIPRIENHPALKMRTISMYNIYKKETRQIYSKGDTHWNNQGLQLWLAEVNKMLLSYPAN